ncbi:MAG: hypothetical protein U0441_02475 [Polyangiaceae bacterium]
MRVVRLAILLAPLWLVPVAFVAVLRTGTPPAPLVRGAIPNEAHTAAHCTWSCHNHGCNHVPSLPAFLSGDAGLFGWTVRALHAAGDRAMPGDRFAGYGAVNLAVFCAVWPAAMFALYVIAVRQRFRIIDARRASVLTDAKQESRSVDVAREGSS